MVPDLKQPAGAEPAATSLVAVRDARERIIATLSDAFARDDLDMDEFERRLGIAHRTDSLFELEKLATDLTPVAAPALSTALVPHRAAALSAGRDRQRLVAVL